MSTPHIQRIEWWTRPRRWWTCPRRRRTRAKKKENGGELTIYTEENGTEKPIDLFPFPGRVVIFESQELEHEVQQVKNDKRLSITGWLKTR